MCFFGFGFLSFFPSFWFFKTGSFLCLCSPGCLGPHSEDDASWPKTQKLGLMVWNNLPGFIMCLVCVSLVVWIYKYSTVHLERRENNLRCGSLHPTMFETRPFVVGFCRGQTNCPASFCSFSCVCLQSCCRKELALHMHTAMHSFT